MLTRFSIAGKVFQQTLQDTRIARRCNHHLRKTLRARSGRDAVMRREQRYLPQARAERRPQRIGQRPQMLQSLAAGQHQRCWRALLPHEP